MENKNKTDAGDPSPSDHDRTAENDLRDQLRDLELKEGEGNGNGEWSRDQSENDDDGIEKRKAVFPLRPEAEDCAYYMKTGNCKFGSNCKFNHPVKRQTQAAEEKVNERESAAEKASHIECKYYLRTGGCKYGDSCRYKHSKAKTSEAPAVELNFLSLPIRPGEKECPYYMRTGSCKFGADCKFNHPEPTAVGRGDPSSRYGDGGSIGSVSSQATLQANSASWSSSRVLDGSTPPFVPVMFSPNHGVPSQTAEWNGYQAPVYPPGSSIHPPATYLVNNSPSETSVYMQYQPQVLVDEFPERPGQPECSYYIKTGDCKFRSKCKYHHPKNRSQKQPPCALNDQGLPLRPDQNICTDYSRYGICKFGPACRFDHPVHPPSSTAEVATVHANGNESNGWEL